MRKISSIRAFFILAILAAGIMVFAATRPGKTTADDVCSESQEGAGEKTKTQGEFIILEALNRAVMATAR